MTDFRRTRRRLDAMSKEKQQLLIDAVADLGEEAIRYAFNKRHAGWGPRPIEASEGRADEWYSEAGNLHDSFGSAVYVNGVLQKDTIRYVDNEQWMKRPTSRYRGGRKALDDYLNRIKPTSKKNEVFLVVVAAMPYTKFLEKGTHYGGYKIHVISEARSYIDKNWHKIESRVYAKLGLRKPAAKVVKGDTKLLDEAGYEL